MARKRKKKITNTDAKSTAKPVAASTVPAAKPRTARQVAQSRRKWIIAAAGTVCAIGGASVLHAWDVRTREQHDLSAIGQGVPVVVQVHDRSCPTCRRLKGIMGGVMSDRDDVKYRLADLAKPEGQALARKYNVPKVTLLFFDAKGKHQYTHTGLLTADEISALIERHS